jgi:hypothetical protein
MLKSDMTSLQYGNIMSSHTVILNREPKVAKTKGIKGYSSPNLYLQCY